MIKAISFDLDGVYFKNGKSNFIFNLLDLGISEADSKRIFLQSDKMNHEYKTGKISDIAFWTWALHEWKLKKSVKEVTELLISGYEINEEAVEYVRTARKVGYTALVCSNNFPARVLGLDERFHFLRDFDAAVFSYQVGAIKPDPNIYKELIRRSGVEAQEILMADDDPVILEEAKKLGINCIAFTDFASFTKDLERWGVTV